MILKNRKLMSMLMMAFMSAWGVTGAFAGTTVTVSNLTDLQTQLENDAVSTIIVSNTITISADVTLDGNGKTIQVATPYCDESGHILSSGYSNYNVFTVSSGHTLKISNMTIYGGRYQYDESNSNSVVGGIYVLGSGRLNAENVVVSRSSKAVLIGSSDGVGVFKNCSLSRNSGPYACGLHISGTAMLDGCTLTENNVDGSFGEGGAIECNGTLYINNSIIANNSTANQCKGSINTNMAKALYVVNSTICGNYGENGAGGITLSDGPSGTPQHIYVVNSIVSNNVSKIDGSITYTDFDDVGGTVGAVDVYNSIYGSYDTNFTRCTFHDCIQTSDADAVFAEYRTDGVIFNKSTTTDGFRHPALVQQSGKSNCLYAPQGSKTATGGCNTYFSYNEDLSTVNIGYGSDASITSLLGNPTASDKVTTYYEGSTRASGVIGASAVSTSTYYTVKLTSENLLGKVSGASIYGESYAANSNATVSVTPNDGYTFKEWYDKENGVVLSSDNPYTFAVTGNSTVWPLIGKSATSHFVIVKDVEGVTVTDDENNKLNVDGGYEAGTSIYLKPTCALGYAVTRWNFSDGTLASENSSYSFTMPNSDVCLVPVVDVAPKVTATCSVGGRIVGLPTGGYYDKGYHATLLVAINTGYSFKGWKKSASETTYLSTSTTYDFIVNSDMTLYAEFERQPSKCYPGLGVQVEISEDSEYPWRLTDGYSGCAYVSTNVHHDNTESENTLTITPNDGMSYYLSFNYGVSSESSFDLLNIDVINENANINTIVASNISGENSGLWTSSSVLSTPLTGVTTIKLKYSKDGSDYDGDDRGYIYNITCTPGSSDIIKFANADKDGIIDAVPSNTSAWETYLDSHKGAVGYTDVETVDKDNVFVKQSDNSYKAKNLSIADGTDFVIPEEISSADMTADAAQYSRSQSSNVWGTLCLPFTFKVDNSKFKCYNLKSTDLEKGEMIFALVADGTEIEAGTPVIVKKIVKDEGTTTITSGNDAGTTIKVVNAGKEVEQAPSWTLHGTFASMSLTKDGYFFSGDKFWYTDFAKYSDPVTIPAYRAYFTVDDSAAAKWSSFTIEAFDGDTATEIGTIDANGNATFYDGPVYNLAGQQTSKSANGIVIVNGKKVIR